MKLVRLAALAVGLALVGGSVAGAFTVPPTEVLDGTEGEVRLLWTEPVAAEDVGKDCEAVLTTSNNESIREGTDIIVASGTTSLVAENVEHDTASERVVGRLTLGTTITVSVRLGPEGLFSGGADVADVTCPIAQDETVTREETVTPAPPAVVTSPTFTG